MKLARHTGMVNTAARTVRAAGDRRARAGLAMPDHRCIVGRGFVIGATLLLIGAIWASGVRAWPSPEPLRSDVAPVVISPALADALAGRPSSMAILALDAADDDDAAIAAAQDRALASLGSDFALTHRYRHIPALAGRLDRDALTRLAAIPGLRMASEDPELRGLLNDSVPFIGVDRLHRRGVDGEGVNVAVIDTGVDAGNLDLREAVVDQVCTLVPRDRCGSGDDLADDVDGHGTHVAGIVASRGRRAGDGVAPAAGIIAVKFLETRATGAGSNMLEALDELLGRDDLDIINMSLGTTTLFDGECDDLDAYHRALSAAFGRLDEAGVISVAASGNDGSRNQMASPACIAKVLSVGAVDVTARQIASFTNRSPFLDFLAPGVIDESANPPVGIEAPVPGDIGRKMGTSMAAPHVAGALALLKAEAPWADADLLIQVLRENGQRPTLRLQGNEAVTIKVDSALSALERIVPTATPVMPTETPIPPSATPEPATETPTAVPASATPTEDPATQEPSPTTRPTDPAIPTPEPTSEALPAYLPRLVRP